VTRAGPGRRHAANPHSPVNATTIRHWVVVPARHRAMPSPYRAVALTGPSQTASPPRAGYKSRRLPLARAHRAPLCAIEGLRLSFSSHLLSESLHAPSPCTWPPWSSHACLLPRPRYPLAGARVPVASTAGLRQAPSPAPSRPRFRPPSDPWWAPGLFPHSPSQPHRRPRRNLASRAAPSHKDPIA
jgi:hypothetical protein